jgi:hypothetical protein
MPEEYERTISGLIKKRAEMMGELHALRERMGVVTNDLQCLDRVLQAFGYEGDLEGLPVAKSKLVLFHKSELQQHVLHVLRSAAEPLSSRDIAVGIATTEGRDRYDKRAILDIIKRVGKCLGTLRYRGLVLSKREPKGRVVWWLAGQRQTGN